MHVLYVDTLLLNEKKSSRPDNSNWKSMKTYTETLYTHTDSHTQTYKLHIFMVPGNMHEKVFLLIKFFEGVLSYTDHSILYTWLCQEENQIIKKNFFVM